MIDIYSKLDKLKKVHKLKLTPVQLLPLGFAIIILTGAVILSLPISSRSGQWTPFIDSLLTATSATCVTGLVVYNTLAHWNVFGQIVIILLIQIGGLGFMTMATLFSFLLRRNITLGERLVMMQTLNLEDINGIIRLTKNVLLGTFLFEGAGAVILSLRFIGEYGVANGIFKGVFHSISAFCNAGFDLFGGDNQFVSLTAYADDFVVSTVIMLLIIIGGLGFFVWGDILRVKSFKKLQPYSKLVITVTVVLLLGGALIVALLEWNNPKTLGMFGLKGKVLASFFQSVTPRTAGFNTIDLPSMRPGTKLLTCVLMFIGGASGSTAGGIKVGTAGVIILAVLSIARGNRDVIAYNRKINNDIVLRAFSVFAIGAGIVFTGVVIIGTVDPFPLTQILFECFSAFGTVGLTLGITPLLSTVSKIVITLLMYFGRVGIYTITIAVAWRFAKKHNAITYPETRILIG